MSDKSLQEEFMSKAQEQNIPVTMFLMNGFQMRGTIVGYDEFSVLLSSEGKENLIYKHAISTIQPQRAVYSNPPT